jgi:hypothetical protein
MADTKTKAKTETWMEQPEEHDYPAAASYLGLILDEKRVNAAVAALRAAALSRFKAKDLLRASQLPLLPEDNAHVAKDLQKVKDGKQLSPVLVLRGDMTSVRPLQVADGYHRICASYHIDENTDIPCRLADL